MEIKVVSFTTWRWDQAEALLQLDANSYGVSMSLLGRKYHWFLKQTLSYEMHGPIGCIVRFLKSKLDDGTILKASVPVSVRRRLGNL